VNHYVDVYRGRQLESRHTVHAVVVNGKGKLIASVGDPDLATYFRSSAKPFQTLALFRSGTIRFYEFGERDIALFTASHNGEEVHIQGVRSILERIGASEADLRCGFHPPLYPPAQQKFYCEHRIPSPIYNFHPPLYPPAQQKFYCEHRIPSPIYNNCSGKHAGMLAACIQHEYDLSTYLEPDHPHQQHIRDIIAEFSGVPAPKLQTAVDGCGVPVYFLPLQTMAHMYARLAVSQDPDVVRLRSALMNHPELVAGKDRFDTDFMRLVAPRAFSKTGAEGVQGIAFLEPEPIAIFAKAEDGTRRAVDAAVVDLCLKMNLITREEAEALQKYWCPSVLNHAGKIVGQIKPNLELRYHP